MAILFVIGIILFIIALNIEGFFIKLILWAGGVCLMVYTLPEIGFFADRPYSEQVNASLFFVGLLQVVATIVEYKFLGIVLYREVSDFLIHGLGILLMIVGLVRECWM